TDDALESLTEDAGRIGRAVNASQRRGRDKLGVSVRVQDNGGLHRGASGRSLSLCGHASERHGFTYLADSPTGRQDHGRSRESHAHSRVPSVFPFRHSARPHLRKFRQLQEGRGIGAECGESAALPPRSETPCCRGRGPIPVLSSQWFTSWRRRAMWGVLFLMGCLFCIWFGRIHWRRYHHGPSPDPIWLGEALLGFLGAAANLVAAVVAFFS